MRDLSSRYKFLPLAEEYPVGEEIAGCLSEKFDRYGDPLVLKRDNEGNPNHKIVNDILEEFSHSALKQPCILCAAFSLQNLHSFVLLKNFHGAGYILSRPR